MHAHSATISGHVRTYAWGISECRPRYIYIFIARCHGNGPIHMDL